MKCGVVFGTCLLLVHSNSKSPFGKILSLRPVVFVGLISYSAYLWHQPLFAFARIYAIGEPSRVVIYTMIAMTFVLATLTWALVETPTRRASWVGPKGVFISSASVALLLVCLGGWIYLQKGFPSRLAPHDADLTLIADVHFTERAFVY